MVRILGALAALCLLATACRAPVEIGEAPALEVAFPPTNEVAAPPADASDGDLPALGPVTNRSHWHAAYVARICDDVLAPFDSSDDVGGIHSHNDGLIHVHPFFDPFAFEQATIGKFAVEMGLSLSDGELTLPTGGTWRDGDLCGDVPGRVYVDRWPDSSRPGEVERIFEGLADIRFEADGEMYQIAFAPVDAPPVIPPSEPSLVNVMPAPVAPTDPWVETDLIAARDEIRLWLVADVSEPPCTDDAISERTRSEPQACFTPAGDPYGPDAIIGSRAIVLNRAPGVELRLGGELDALLNDQTSQFGPRDPLVAIEIAGGVVSTGRFVSSAEGGGRLLLSRGFDEESARALASLLAG